MASDSPKPLNLAAVVRSYLASAEDATSIAKVVPVAWPVLHVEQTLTVRVEEQLGVVERYLLEALARFGPMEPSLLADLLGLEEFVVRSVVQGLARLGDAVIVQAGTIAVPLGTLGRLESGAWSRIAERPYAFFVNGVTTEILPTQIDKTTQSFWLKLNLADQDCVVRDATGKSLPTVQWVPTQATDARGALRSILSKTDSAARRAASVPDGAQGVVDRPGRIVASRTLLALARVDLDGRVTVTSSNHPEIVLCSGSADTGNLLNPSKVGWRSASLRLREHGVGEPRDVGETGGHANGDVPEEWLAHARFERRSKNRLIVSLHTPTGVSPWPERATTPAVRQGAEAATEPSPASEPLPKQLRLAMDRDLMWNPANFTVLKIEPGDEATAKVQLLLGGLHELQRIATRGVEADWRLDAWWDGLQERRSSAWPAATRDARVSIAEFTSAARKSPEGHVVEFLSDRT